MGSVPRKPVIGVLCCNEVVDRPVQVVASRFVAPLTTLSDATVLLVPALARITDATQMAGILDGLLLTGSRSHVAPTRYGSDAVAGPLDEQRDEVALALAGRMIEVGKPVFGICRGMQEINVLFGGTLAMDRGGSHHLADDHAEPDDAYEALFAHRHDVELTHGGRLAGATGARQLSVNSVHHQGVDRLGHGLSVEAVATGDGLVEAIWARPCGADVLAVQWHPEWNAERCAGSRAFFAMVGASLRGVAH
ncbi:peptidase C26 [Sphingomonas sp. Leaf339]|uniref:gamma-glutamyl-gamma-aminobutyrate hydrolase family protein n=1 Tax=Sphingomonas sp. Leaf339 TaxID=1736343 RepID=UPI0006F75895|nr:gamma-glutamyl-gamma-aminobutyrate hydrolase family protein [Sphingomonas sp. Leaf339]KQU53178.1 peptidase C26 [Sphingomonas sp. Leaf339]